MPDVKISALPASTTPLAGTEVLPIVQSATTRQVSVANLTAGRAVSALSLTASSLTSGRVTYAGTAGLLSDSSSLTYNGTNLLTITANSSELVLAGGSSAAQGGFLTISRGGTNKILIGTASNVIGGGSNTSDDLALFATANTRFYASSAESMRLTSTGLGIGTTSPTGKLTVNTSINSEGVIRIGDNATYYGELSRINPTDEVRLGSYGASQNLTFYTVASERMRIDSSGNLGLGVTPSAASAGNSTFQFGAQGSLLGTSGEIDLSVNAYFNSGWKYIGTGTASQYQQGGGVHRWYYAASGTAGNAISFTQAMTLDASGNLGIGTTSPSTQLHLQSNSATYIQITDVGDGSSRIGQNGTALTFGVDSGNGSTERMRIASTGIVTMSAYGAGAATFDASGVISSVSDETWKIKDGVPINTDAMLQKLKPGYWFYNDEKKEIFSKDRQLGFYAQNVHEAIGEEAAPTPEKYKDKDGNDTDVSKPWGYYDRSVLAVAVMSLKTALNTIEELKQRIETLEN